MCCTRLAENTGRKKIAKKFAICAPSHNFVGLSSQLRHVSMIGKKWLNSNISSTCPHNMANFGPLAAEIGSGVWSTPEKFQRVSDLVFVTAATSLTGGQPNFADVWLSPGLVHYIYIFGGSCPWWNFAWCKIDFMSKSCVLLYCQRYCTAL